MPEENQNQTLTLESIVGEMKNISGLSYVLNSYDLAKDPSDQAGLLDTATRILSNAQPGTPLYEQTLGQLEGDRGSAYLKLDTSRSARLGIIEEAYKANKEKILEAIINKFNKDLQEAKDMNDAVKKISYAFQQLFVIPEISQDEANRYATESLREKTKMPIMTRQVYGNPDEMRDLRYRMAVSEFVKEEKGKDEKTIYSVDKEKLTKLVENPVAGSILYTAEKPKEQKKQAA